MLRICSLFQNELHEQQQALLQGLSVPPPPLSSDVMTQLPQEPHQTQS